jgi:alkylation response protein AidB-like acyl-CoA dehydrogenase
MDFELSEDQELLRQEVRKFLEGQSPLPEVRKAADTPDGYSKAVWKQLGELGFLGLIFPSEYGGAGLGWVDLVVLLEETGRTLLPSPLISSVLAGATILDVGSDEQKRRWIPSLADASRVGTLAVFETPDQPGVAGVMLEGKPDAEGFVLTGEKRFVADANRADLFVVAFRCGGGDADLALAVVERDAAGVSTEKNSALDATKESGTLRLDGVRVGPDAMLAAAGAARGAIELALDRGAAAVTAEAIGAMEGAHSITVEFAKQRVQFGNPIGHYQGVKHPLADAYVDIECLKSLLYYAAWALDASPEHVPLAVAEAKAFASEAFPRLGVTGIQLHGGVGFTLEYDIQLYLKRSKWYRQEFGDEDYFADRIANLGGY